MSLCSEPNTNLKGGRERGETSRRERLARGRELAQRRVLGQRLGKRHHKALPERPEAVGGVQQQRVARVRKAGDNRCTVVGLRGAHSSGMSPIPA